MDLTVLTNNLPLISALVGAVLASFAWVAQDTAFKTKMASLEEKVTLNKTTVEAAHLDLQTKQGNIIIQNAKSEQDRQELHYLVDKLDNNKASKDVVDGFKSEITSLRAEMDKGFDRLGRQIERLIEYKILKIEQRSEDVS